MKINIKNIRLGSIIEYKNSLWTVIKSFKVKPGKGGAFNQIELKNLLNKSKLNERFRSEETIKIVQLTQKKYYFLYTKGTKVILINKENFEEINVDKNIFGNKYIFLKDNMELILEFYKKNLINICFPYQAKLKIIESEPVIKGQKVTSSYKPAILENGIRILVPPFIKKGENIIIDINQIKYLKRSY